MANDSNALPPRTGEIDPDARDLAWLNRQLGVGDRLVVSAASFQATNPSAILEEEKIEMLADVLRSVDVERLIDAGVTRIDICDRGRTDLYTRGNEGTLYINVYSGQSRSDTIRDICEAANIDSPEGYTDEDATRITTGYLSLPPPRMVRRRVRFLLAIAAGSAIGGAAALGVIRSTTRHENETVAPTRASVKIPSLPPVPPVPNAAGKTPPLPPRIVATPNPDPGVIRETCRVRFADTGVMDTEGMPIGHYGSCDTTVAAKVTPVMEWIAGPYAVVHTGEGVGASRHKVNMRLAKISFHLENPPRDCMAGPIEVKVGKTRDYPDVPLRCDESPQ